MSQASNNSLALHEILLSIADSLNVAQHQLRSMTPYDEYGRLNTLYQLPYLDFSLEVISEAVSEIETTTEPNKAISNPEFIRTTAFRTKNKITKQSRQALAYRLPAPSQNKTTNNSASNKITSTISGRFVAVMPNEGVPQVFIVMDTEKVSTTEYKLKVKLTYATNEPVVGQKVEINFDEATSLTLNDTATTITPPLFSPSKEGFTKGDGVYETSITIESSDVNKTIIFVANSGTIFTSVAISNT